MERNWSISSIRGNATVLIILSHIFMLFNSELYLWFNIGVQLFILISSELFAKRDIIHPLAWVCHRVRYILMPYYTYLAIVFLIGRFAGYPVNFEELFRYLSVSQGIGGGMVAASFCPAHLLGHLWYITYILLAYVFTPFLESLTSTIVSNRFKLLFGCCLLVVFQMLINRFFVIPIIHAWFIPLYFFGYIYFRKNPDALNKSLEIYTIFFVLCVIAKLFLRIIIINHEKCLAAPGLFFIASVGYNFFDLFSGIFLYFLLRKQFEVGPKVGQRWGWILEFSDRYSYGIYLTHMLGLMMIFNYTIGWPKIFQGIVAIAICIPIGFLFSHITFSIHTVTERSKAFFRDSTHV